LLGIDCAIKHIFSRFNDVLKTPVVIIGIEGNALKGLDNFLRIDFTHREKVRLLRHARGDKKKDEKNGCEYIYAHYDIILKHP
jgi:hypothetical protein